MKKNAMTKIVAGLAFFGILISIIGTGLLIIFGESVNQNVELSPEQIAEIQQMIESQSGSLESNTGAESALDISNEILTETVPNQNGE